LEAEVVKQTRETLGEEMGKREGGWGKKAFARLSIAFLVMLMAAFVVLCVFLACDDPFGCLCAGYMVPRREGGWVCLKYTMGVVHATSRIR